jgi:iron complex transport system substrate-binding protein
VPSITESLYELGLEKFVVGITFYCPKGKTEKEIVGTLLECNLEKVILLNPDLIVLMKEGNTRPIYEKLKLLGFDIYIVKSSKNFDEICINYLNLAKKLNKEKTGIEIVKTAKNLLKKNYNNLKLKKEEKLKIFWEIYSKPIFTFGNKSFVNDYNYYLNAINIYDDFDTGYFITNIEDVINKNPDVILLIDDGINSTEKITNWNKYKMVSAVKNNNVFIVDICSNYIFKPTPLKFVKSIEILSNIIYHTKKS